MPKSRRNAYSALEHFGLPPVWLRARDHPLFKHQLFKTYATEWATWCKIQVGQGLV
jgi:hypothetical protein